MFYADQLNFRLESFDTLYVNLNEWTLKPYFNGDTIRKVSRLFCSWISDWKHVVRNLFYQCLFLSLQFLTYLKILIVICSYSICSLHYSHYTFMKTNDPGSKCRQQNISFWGVCLDGYFSCPLIPWIKRLRINTSGLLLRSLRLFRSCVILYILQPNSYLSDTSELY